MENKEAISKMFSDYEKSHEKKTYTATPQNILEKYFTPRNRNEVFRILPPLKADNGKIRDIVEHAYFHSIPINIGRLADGKLKKGYSKVYCPAHNDAKVPKLGDDGKPVLNKSGEPIMVSKYCPLCEKEKAILATQDNSLKGVKKENYTAEQRAISDKNKEIWKEAKKYSADKYYIIRGIDKGTPKDGVKFWRFKHNYKQQGIHDKLMAAIKEFIAQHKIMDFTDVEKGCDFSITVVDSELPNGRTYKDVSSIMPRPPSKLYEDPIVAEEWLEDPIIWRDVFKPKTMRVLDAEEYLERVARGTNPYWDDSDENNKRWVFPDPADRDLEVAANTRDENLDADSDDDSADEVASDIINSTYNSNISIENITKENVEESFKEDSSVETETLNDVLGEEEEEELQTVSDEDSSDDDDEYNYDDLPF